MKLSNLILPILLSVLLFLMLVPLFFFAGELTCVLEMIMIASLACISFVIAFFDLKVSTTILTLIAISFFIPVINAQLLPDTIRFPTFEMQPNMQIEVQEIPIQLNKESIRYQTLQFSYILILFYLLEYLVYAIFIIALPSLVFFKKTPIKASTSNFHKLCQRIAGKMNVKMPKIYLLKEPEVISFGEGERNAVIGIYEKCDLSEDELEPIFIHEFSHIKSDVSFHSLNYLLNKFHGKFGYLTGLAFLCVAAWFINMLSRTLEVFSNSNQIEGLSIAINNLMPFYIAILSLAEIIFFKSILALNPVILNPSPQIGEFRADLMTFLEVGEEKLINSIHSLRSLKLEYFLKHPQVKSSLFSKISDVYSKLEKKIVTPKEYSDWLEYFRESFSNVIIGRASDSPPDKLRVDFIKFVDKLVNETVSFHQSKERVEIGLLWGIKTAIFNDKIALYEFYRDFRKISISDKKKVIGYLLKNLDHFNAKSCSSETDVELVDVIIIVIMLIVDGSISLRASNGFNKIGLEGDGR
jgi:Zn-dependent protease with chaperone function